MASFCFYVGPDLKKPVFWWRVRQRKFKKNYTPAFSETFLFP